MARPGSHRWRFTVRTLYPLRTHHRQRVFDFCSRNLFLFRTRLTDGVFWFNY